MTAESIWSDLTTRIYPDRVAVLLALVAVVTVLAIPRLWSAARHAVTIAHESGHAVMATLTGRRVSAIRLHADSSGLTTSVGRARRLPLSLVALAGYTGPAVLGLGLAAAISTGYAVAVLWALAIALLLVLVRIRNWMGIGIVLGALALLGAALWWLPVAWLIGLACAVAWLMVLGAVRDVVDLSGLRRRGARGSDADALARLTRVPGGAWVALFWLITVACAVGGAWLLVSPLI